MVFVVLKNREFVWFTLHFSWNLSHENYDALIYIWSIATQPGSYRVDVGGCISPINFCVNKGHSSIPFPIPFSPLHARYRYL